MLRRSRTVANGSLPALPALRADPGMNSKSLKNIRDFKVFMIFAKFEQSSNAINRHHLPWKKHVFVDVCCLAKIIDLDILRANYVLRQYV